MQELKVAILDMYKGETNQGMRNINEILDKFACQKNIKLQKQIFDIRLKNEMPSLDFDAYISTGGPGSPIEQEGWEEAYMARMLEIMHHNMVNPKKKTVFLICHSFQVMCYHLHLGKVCLRKSESFGIFPMHKTDDAINNSIMRNLPDPFYAVDSRKWQVVQPNTNFINNLNSTILALEKIRPHVELERAMMAIQFTPEIFGTQFHPEADSQGMLFYLEGNERMKFIIENYGQKKYDEMIEYLKDSKKIMLTQSEMIPTFLENTLAINSN
ncbi:MAG: homoserine O-succinyltransferase [Bacteroidetes bacterium]|nr:homoserine O-succinyltransferase [Bacteroidota bacterium]